MIQISFSKLTNQELFTLGMRTKEIIDPVIKSEMGISAYYQKFNDSFEPYKLGIEHTHASAETISIKDNVRDDYSIAFRNHIKNYLYHPTLSTKARAVLEVIDKHGPNITRKGYETQTAINVQIIDDINKNHLDFVNECYAQVWFDLFVAAQTDFESTVKEHGTDKAGDAAIESATSTRPALVNAMRKLFTFLPMQYELTEMPELGQIINELKVETDRY